MTTFLANNKGLVFGFYFAVGEEGDDEDDAKGTYRQQDPEQPSKTASVFYSYVGANLHFHITTFTFWTNHYNCLQIQYF